MWGKTPSRIAFSHACGTVYVANSGSNSISVVDTNSNKVVGKFQFTVNPSNSGHVECNEINAPLEKYVYIYADTYCKVIPNKGFEFLSWAENLGNDSSRLISINQPSPITIYDHLSDISDTVTSFFGVQPHIDTIMSYMNNTLKLSIIEKSEEFHDYFGIISAANQGLLNTTTFGSYAANFRALPPPLSSGYWTTLFGFVLTTGLGVWLIPSLVRWRRAKTDTIKSNYYHEIIKSLYHEVNLNLNNGNNNKVLDLKIETVDAYSKGELTEKHYETLKNEISVLYDKLFRRRIAALKDESVRIGSQKRLNKLRDDLENAFSEQKITETQFKLLITKISEVGEKKNG